MILKNRFIAAMLMCLACVMSASAVGFLSVGDHHLCAYDAENDLSRHCNFLNISNGEGTITANMLQVGSRLEVRTCLSRYALYVQYGDYGTEVAVIKITDKVVNGDNSVTFGYEITMDNQSTTPIEGRYPQTTGQFTAQAEDAPVEFGNLYIADQFDVMMNNVAYLATAYKLMFFATANSSDPFLESDVLTVPMYYPKNTETNDFSLIVEGISEQALNDPTQALPELYKVKAKLRLPGRNFEKVEMLDNGTLVARLEPQGDNLNIYSTGTDGQMVLSGTIPLDDAIASEFLWDINYAALEATLDEDGWTLIYPHTYRCVTTATAHDIAGEEVTNTYATSTTQVASGFVNINVDRENDIVKSVWSEGGNQGYGCRMTFNTCGGIGDYQLKLWRIVGDEVTLLNGHQYDGPEADNFQADYSPLDNEFWGADEFTVTDIFKAPALEECPQGTLNVRYVARLVNSYNATEAAPGRDRPRKIWALNDPMMGGPIVAEATFNVTFDTNVVTSVDAVKPGAVLAGVTYYDVTGRASKRPHDGVNIVVTGYSDGTVITRKVVR